MRKCRAWRLPKGAEPNYIGGLPLMYAVDGNDQVVRVDEFPKMDAGSSAPILINDGAMTIVAYWLRTRDSVLSPEDVAIIKFSRCMAHMFSAPNDEAFDGHPLASHGLEPYGAYRIENSSWLRQLEQMNSVHRQHSSKLFQGYNHYVLAFKEKTFECIAQSTSVAIKAEPIRTIAAEIVAELERL